MADEFINMYKTLYYSLIGILLFSCQQTDKQDSFIKSSTGIEYQFHTQSNSKKARRGSVALLRLTMLNPTNELINFAPFGDGTYGHVINGKGKLAKRIDNILLKSSVGDSLSMRMQASLFFGNTFLPDRLNPQDIITWHAKVIDIMEYTEYASMQAKQQELIAKKRKKADDAILVDYLTKSGLNANKLNGGSYCSVTKQGQGKTPQAGDVVQIHYTVFRLDGQKADASYDRGEPFQFVVGRGEIITGLDKAVRTLKEGGEATILIPSDQAYGAESKGRLLPPHSNLRFEVKLLNVAN